MRIHKRALIVAGIAILLSGVSPVVGGLIYVDFGTGSGSASGLVDGSPANWNVVTNLGIHTFGTLYDSDGQDSGIVLDVTDAFHGVQIGGSWDDPSIPWSVGAATDDNFYAGASPANTAEVTLSNLDPTKQYRISLIASRASGGSRDCIFEVNSQFADVGGVNGSNPFNSYTDGYQNHSLMIWKHIAPDQNDKLSLLLTPDASGHYGYLSAMRIEEIPEPGSLLLLVVGLLLGVVATRRPGRCSSCA